MVWLLVAALSGMLLAGCMATSSPVTPLPSATFVPLPSLTPMLTRLPRPPANLTQTAAPPTIRTIQLNQTVDAIYIPGEVHETYVFTSDRARWVSIELLARDAQGDLRMVLQVYDAAGTLIPKASVPIGQPSLRDVWALPVPGPYTIRLFSPETEARAFDLRLSSVPVPEIGGGSLACDETQSGEIAVHGQRDQWTITGQKNEQITISLLSPGNNGILELYDPAGELIAHTDDATHPTTGTTLTVTLAEGGVYTLVVRMYEDAQAGTYRLSLACGG
ncbi:MAG: hypothetical protein JXA10_00890 [Anaerolineae bacterium]|nr:hypothetical protein [Anaerolineae bacterium]